VPDSPYSMMIIVLTTLLVADMICRAARFRGVLGPLGRVGVVRYFLRTTKASCASLGHCNLSCFFRSLKKGSPLMPSREKKLLKVTTHPINFWMSWRLSGGASFVIADTFSGLGSIPHQETIYPSNIPEGTPNVHFSF
jgi:hypothetical protein